MRVCVCVFFILWFLVCVGVCVSVFFCGMVAPAIAGVLLIVVADLAVDTFFVWIDFSCLLLLASAEFLPRS